MKSKRILLVLCSILLVAAMLAGCSSTPPATPPAGNNQSETTPAPAAPESNPQTPTAPESNDPSDLSNHEIYKYFDEQCFGGTSLPPVDDRSGINKNLPVEQKKDVVIGWSAPSLGNSYFAGIKAGAEEQAAKYGYTLKFLVADNFDSNKQSSDIESLVTQGVDVLVVDPCDTQAQLIDVQRAVDAGIPVVASGVPFVKTAPVITTVVSNNYEGGFVTGMYCAQRYTDPIEMVVIPGLVGHPVTDSRVNGFFAGLIYGKQQMAGTAKEYREDAMLEGYNAFNELLDKGKVDLSQYGVVVKGQAPGMWEEVAGMAAAEDLLTANPDISLIYAENDHMGIGASKVLDQRGLTGKIQIATSADGDRAALELVKEGKLMTTGYNNPLLIARRVIDLIHEIYENGYDANNMPIVTELPARSVDSSNYTEVYDPNSEYAKELDIPFKTIPELNK